jgi:flagellar hook assembly protein FlgD
MDRTVPSGRHEVAWDGRNQSGGTVASGIYFYLMRTPKYRETKRMFLLR